MHDTSLADEAQRRYLNYALSVITSRALPDVRDGLKPVQRRILYAMLHDLRLAPDAKFRKSAAVVGDVMGKYHPHGDASIYDAMVRLAQDFVMRAPLVSGHGNFGSIDGDAPAAMRYTEAKLRPLAMEILSELGQRTVDWRPNYDGTRSEPIVLPSRFPNLLVNGAQGIAVGMATSIPPHNLGEVIDACVALIDTPDLSNLRLLTHVKGPDFPTGGQLHATKKELEAVYTTGQGSLKLRGEWQIEEPDDKRGAPQLVITSIPYGIERKAIVEKIADVILSKKLPALMDVRDESTEEVRIVLELKRASDPQLVMAYLYKHTPLAINIQVNLTCLVPTDNPDVATPRRLGLHEALSSFLEFRNVTVTRRTEFQLGEMRQRIHILEGFEKVFDALDEVIKIIRRSEGKADAAEKLMKRFELSDEQVDAILELRLYRLARLEILVVQRELAEKRAEATRLESLLKSDTQRWKLVRDELLEVKRAYPDRRRTKIVGAVDEPEYQEEDFIIAEDANVILSAQGWVKRVREVKDLSTTRLRDGDTVLAAVAGSTRASIAFFSNLGSCYVCRIHDVQPSSGYGDPVQKLFKLGDGERMVAMYSFDPRALDVPAPSEDATESEPPFAVAVTRGGLGFRFSLRPHRDPSTRAGRRFARLNDGDEVLAVLPSGVRDEDMVLCASSEGYAIGVPVSELTALSGPGKGSILMKVEEGDRLLGAVLALEHKDVITVETDKGKVMDLRADKIAGSRGGKGQQIVKRDRFARVVPSPVVAPTLEVS
ncbi:DNA gyrase/topoisomerase IV subunit A [Chondromyces apiculatus]|uniref:DNA topoisomerase (ATP-hydrolyzing) n=1 Tax=Chondromyces apiculatus DSM 436 TaxID=1192034 RepID=A0A017T7L6_9BACT|nr:DNA topoisomerase IV subunit A [Chondromyces apiculatus]EYF05263.1 Topoisomerase IV subunit A [Chondromyces apiculatus DSM 436]